MHGNPDAIEYFTALVCGEPLPEISDDGGDGEGPSLESICYLLNYERFAHHEAGPNDGDVPKIFPAGAQFADDVVDGDDVCLIKVEGDEDFDRNRPCDQGSHFNAKYALYISQCQFENDIIFIFLKYVKMFWH